MLHHYFVHHVRCTVLFLLSLGLFVFSVKMMDNIWNYYECCKNLVN